MPPTQTGMIPVRGKDCFICGGTARSSIIIADGSTLKGIPLCMDDLKQVEEVLAGMKSRGGKPTSVSEALGSLEFKEIQWQ